VLVVNSTVVLLTACLYSLETVLYTMIFLYVNSRVLNLVVTGLSQRKAVFIVSPRWKEISDEIMNGLHRGVTFLYGKGGYTGSETCILYVVVAFRNIGPLKNVIRRIDPRAFVVVTDTLEVMNPSIGNQPHW